MIEAVRRCARLFRDDEHGRRPCFGTDERMQNDPGWHNNLLFHEYFHCDNGAGLGASHQTGWTGLDADRGIVVGACSVGPRGGEVLSMFNLAVHARVPVSLLNTMIYAYPTFYRGALDALAKLA